MIVCTYFEYRKTLTIKVNVFFSISGINLTVTVKLMTLSSNKFTVGKQYKNGNQR